MSKKKRVVIAVGTRPEAIKLAPVILRLRRESWCDVFVLATGQHRELLTDTLAHFGISPDLNLGVMTENQTLSSLTGKLFELLSDELGRLDPDLLIAQGDTTTVFVSSVVCFYLKIPFAHVEAGLRSGSLTDPFPEEFNRLATSLVTDLHFSPTRSSTAALLSERVDRKSVFQVGNTVIDALKMMQSRNPNVGWPLNPSNRLVMLTAHRRENFGEPLENVLNAVRDIVAKHDDVEFVYPVHPNPNVRGAAERILGDLPRVQLTSPMDYPEFVATMNASSFLVTDSGGVQEEGPALGKPVLVIRNETERPEAISDGVAKLVGTDRDTVFKEIDTLLTSQSAFLAMARGVSPYGDGLASERISDVLSVYFGLSADRQTAEFGETLAEMVQTA